MVKGIKDKIFDRFMDFLGFVLIALVAFVIIFVISASISDPKLVAMGKVYLFPKGINFDAYKSLLTYGDIWLGYKNAVIYTVLGTFINIAVTVLTAYPLSRKDFKGKNILTLYFVITMYFGGGLVPTFLVIKGCGMYNTMWALLIPGAVSVYNMIICRTYFQSSVPYEIQESAKIEGCSDFGILFRIVLPVSGAVIAVLVMFFALGHWNSYMGPLIYLQDREKFPLQIFLNEILVKSQQTSINSMMSEEQLRYAQKQADKAELLKYALVIVSSLPFMIVYPMLQKFFVKGVMVGSIKG